VHSILREELRGDEALVKFSNCNDVTCKCQNTFNRAKNLESGQGPTSNFTWDELNANKQKLQLFALGSSHVKFDVGPWPCSRLFTLTVFPSMCFTT